MEQEIKELVDMARAKKVRRVVSITIEHDSFLRSYNASELFGLLLDRFIDEREAAEAANGYRSTRSKDADGTERTRVEFPAEIKATVALRDGTVAVTLVDGTEYRKKAHEETYVRQ